MQQGTSRPDTTDVDMAARQFKALGHPVRLRIFRELAAHDSYCGDLVELTGLAQSTVSHHLKVLRDAHLVISRAEGTSTCYRVSNGGLDIVRRWLEDLLIHD